QLGRLTSYKFRYASSCTMSDVLSKAGCFRDWVELGRALKCESTCVATTSSRYLPRRLVYWTLQPPEAAAGSLLAGSQDTGHNHVNRHRIRMPSFHCQGRDSLGERRGCCKGGQHGGGGRRRS